MTADPPVPMSMEGERERDLDGTGSFRQGRWEDRHPPPPPPSPHPVKDIVLPLAVVITLLANALMIGVAWGRFSQRMENYEGVQTGLAQRITDAEKAALVMRDRMHDAERDIKEDQRRFYLLDDYTRGRVDRLPYKSPPPARW
jgi:hypothetical protein